MEHLQGKCVLLCVSGGIAAYKIPNVASALRKAGAEVHVVMTRNATEFITPLTFESLTNHRCVVDTFDRNFPYDIHHISLATAAGLSSAGSLMLPSISFARACTFIFHMGVV